MTEDFARRLRKKRPGSHDEDAAGIATTVAREITYLAKPEFYRAERSAPAICRSRESRGCDECREVCKEEEDYYCPVTHNRYLVITMIFVFLVNFELSYCHTRIAVL